MSSRLTAALLILLSTSAQAADLVLVCPITITRGTSEVTVKRRLEIDYDTHKVAEYIDQGKGWTKEAMLELVVADTTDWFSQAVVFGEVTSISTRVSTARLTSAGQLAESVRKLVGID
jgi:hypothetical protein